MLVRHPHPALVVAAVVAVAVAAGAWAARPAGAFSRGRIGNSGNPATNGGQTCAQCHSGGVDPVVTLDGPSSVAPGATTMLTLTVAGGQSAGAGLGVSATAGTLGVPAGALDVQIVEDELTHSGVKDVTDDAAVFRFLWTAPDQAGPVTLYAAGNSVNLNSRPSGDAAVGVTLDIAVGGAVETPTATATGGIPPTATATEEPPPTATVPPPPDFEVVADGLASPHGMSLPLPGQLLVGLGGTGDGPPGEFAPGNGDAGLVAIDLANPASRTVVLRDITNGIDPGGGIVGVNHAIGQLSGGLPVVLAAVSGGPVQARPAEAARILRVGLDGSATLLADTLAFEEANNPDGFPPTDNPLTSGVDSNPWRLVTGPDGDVLVVDAGANDILRLDPATGALSLWAVFPALNVEGSQQPIPTGLAFDPAEPGVAYASLLGGFAPPGSGRIHRLTDRNEDGDVLDAGENTMWVDGLWLPTDLQFAPGGALYVAQLGGGGAVLHVSTDDGDAMGAARPMVTGIPALSAMLFLPNGDLLVNTTGSPAPPPAPNLRADRIVRIPAALLAPEEPETPEPTPGGGTPPPPTAEPPAQAVYLPVALDRAAVAP